MERLKERLGKRGWTKREISKTISILNKINSAKTKHNLAVEKTVYWTAFIVSVFGNFLVSFSLIPVIVALESPMLYGLVAIMGLLFGTLAWILMRDIAHINRHHHILFGAIIPLIAVFNTVVILAILNLRFNSLPLDNRSPLIIGVVYAAAFIIPYFFYKIARKDGVATGI